MRKLHHAVREYRDLKKMFHNICLVYDTLKNGYDHCLLSEETINKRIKHFQFITNKPI